MIDQKVMDAHQWVVDETERKPAWWAEQTAWAYAAIGLVSDALTWDGGWDVLFLALNLVVAAACILVARAPTCLSSVGASAGFSRAILWGLVALRLFGMAFAPDPAIAARLLHAMLGLSFLYFAGCKPPRPRAPRRQVAPA
jgi:hypothetical protein